MGVEEYIRLRGIMRETGKLELESEKRLREKRKTKNKTKKTFDELAMKATTKDELVVQT